MLFRRLGLCCLCLALGVAHAAPPTTLAPAPVHARSPIDIATSSTSIYIGKVTLIVTRLVRSPSGYDATYKARVFPFFFENESGDFSITLSDDQLRQLERGERVQFTGRARNTSGDERRIDGHATPTDATSGKIKVRIYVSKRIVLVFNTTYRFADK